MIPIQAPTPPGACINEPVIQNKIYEGQTYRKDTGEERWKNRNVFLPWVESGEAEKAWKRKQKS